MDYTKSSGYVTDAQGRRQFIDRNDAAGVQGTFITQHDLNGPQNEIVSAIKRFGITPSDETDEQLPLAMNLSGALAVWSQDVVDLTGGYPKYAIVCDANGKRWRSLIDGNKDTPSASASWIDASGGRLLAIQYFFRPGTYTYQPTAGTTAVKLRVLGAGGGSGGTAATGNNQFAAAGGGIGGTYAESGLLNAPDPGTLITVGAGGSGAVAGPNRGNAGSASSVGSLLTCPGGGGGGGGTANAWSNIVAQIGPPSSQVTGYFLYAVLGQPATNIVGFESGLIKGGDGGGCYFGAGGAGGQSIAAAAGSPAPNYGGGGGGAGVGAGAPAYSGADGGGGIVVIEEYA